MRQAILLFTTPWEAKEENWEKLVKALFQLYTEGFRGLYFSPTNHENNFEVCFMKRPELESGSFQEKISAILASVEGAENMAVKCQAIAFVPLHAGFRSFTSILWERILNISSNSPILSEVIKSRLNTNAKSKIFLEKLISLVKKHKRPVKLKKNSSDDDFFRSSDSFRGGYRKPFQGHDIRNNNNIDHASIIHRQQEVEVDIQEAEQMFGSDFELFKEASENNFSMARETEFFEIIKVFNEKGADALKTAHFKHGPLVEGWVKDEGEALGLDFILNGPIVEILQASRHIGSHSFETGDTNQTILREFLPECSDAIIAGLRASLKLAQSCSVNFKTLDKNIGFQIVFKNYPCNQITEDIFDVLGQVMVGSGLNDYFMLRETFRAVPQKKPTQAETKPLGTQPNPVEALEKKLNTTTSSFFGSHKAWKTYPRDRLESNKRDHVVKFLLLPKEEAQQEKDFSACLSQNQFCLLNSGQSKKGDPFVVVDLTLTAGKK